MRIYEKIHHGNRVSIRKITISDDSYATFFDKIVKTCDYASSSPYHNASIKQAHHDLMTTGRGSHGWIDWTITED